MKDKAKYIILLCLTIIGFPVVFEHLIFRNRFYSAVSNDAWASFLGSYVGGAIGGIGTLIAMMVTLKETRRIQAENNDDIEKEKKYRLYVEKKNFTDSVIELVSKFIVNVNMYWELTGEIRGSEDDLKSLMNKREQLYSEVKSKDSTLRNATYGNIPYTSDICDLDEKRRELTNCDYEIIKCKQTLDNKNKVFEIKKSIQDIVYILEIKLDKVECSDKLIKSINELYYLIAEVPIPQKIINDINNLSDEEWNQVDKVIKEAKEKQSEDVDLENILDELDNFNICKYGDLLDKCVAVKEEAKLFIENYLPPNPLTF